MMLQRLSGVSLAQDGAGWYRMVQHGTGWCSMVQHGWMVPQARKMETKHEDEVDLSSKREQRLWMEGKPFQRLG